MDETDLAGIRFGKLVAKKLKTTKGNRIWTCVCDCGNEIEVEEYVLLHGGPRSCGCSKGNYRDYTGERRGKLTAIRPTGEIKYYSPVYIWRCDCGNEVERPIALINKGYESMCEECYSKQKHENIKVAVAAKEEVFYIQCFCGNCA